MKNFSAASLVAICGALMVAPVAAQEYPNKPITIVVPFDPGGGSDLIARTVDKFTSDEFGSTFTFQYRPGAGGHIGTNSVAGAKPDGYTIGTYNSPHIALGPITGVAQYLLEDFTWLGQVAADPGVLATAPGKYSSLDELISAAKDKPGTVTIGSADQFGGTHLLALRIAEESGADISVIPFPGGSQLVAAVLGGHVDAGVAGQPAWIGSKEETQFLAVTGDRHSNALPGVPTLKEQGLDLTYITGRIFIAPAGLDDAVRDRLREGLRNIYENPQFQAELKKVGQNPNWKSGDDLQASMEEYKDVATRLFEKVK
ncbi:Bug family tripartite tricarboxylate transporter substrate binding protein [Microbaculum sp. FT89]|uniref:Bug family tripartite tricarboxylate transporter substrate binding protein n=1 Tax=Microbaculum sp. FT89 TaxID=3447298 RepID=UPI003F52F029